MKTVILAGGMGTRLSEETTRLPKPMIEIGGRPLLLHIMASYAHHGFRDFVVACGYRADVIKRYFHEIYILNSDFRIDLKSGDVEIIGSRCFDWRVACIDTGVETMTGGRVKRLAGEIGDAPFMVTYGDGLSDVDIRALVDFHRRHGKTATVTAVRPAGRFGSLKIEAGQVTEFAEKVEGERHWVNGGFFVFEPAVFDYIADDTVALEEGPLAGLAHDGQLMAYEHHGFWHPVDTLRDRNHLEALWAGGAPPWRPGSGAWPF